MALETFPFRHMPIPSNNINMALFAGYPPCDILPMIKTPTFDLDVSFGFDVARSTTSHGAGYAFLLTFWASCVKMTEKTVGFVNSEVGSLNDLGVTSSAPQSHSSSQLAQMPSVRKAHIFEYHIATEAFPFVTPLLQTIIIINLVM